MAKNDIAVVFFCTLTSIVGCHDMSDNATKTSLLTTAASTINFGKKSQARSTVPQELYVSEDEILNGNFCRRAYICHSDSASERRPSVRGCSCHDYCAIFDECCSDKVYIPPPSEKERFPRASYFCASNKFLPVEIFMINACPVAYEDQSVAENCSKYWEFSSTSMDIRWTPVTDVVTGATFRNMYCAKCWKKTQPRIATWRWKVTCREAQTARGQPLRKNGSSSTASPSGRELPDARTAADYVRSECRLTFEPPLNSSLHFCNNRMITDCGNAARASDLDRQLISACLNGPARYVYDHDSRSAYRNAECAQCANWPNQPTLSCQHLRTTYVPRVYLSLSIILTPDSGDCTDADGGLKSNDDWTPASLCQGLLGCQSEGSSGKAKGCQREPRLLVNSAGRAISSTAVESADTALGNKSIGLCTFIDSPPSGDTVERAQRAAWLNLSYDGGAVLALTLTDNTTQCYVCATERYDNFTVSNRSLVVASSAGQRLQCFDYPMYVVEEGVATVCTALLPRHGRSTLPGEGGCSALPDSVSALFLCLSEAALVVYFAAFARVTLLRRFPGEMVLNESIAFFLAFLFFLVRPLVGSLPAACTALAVLIHYFLLAAFAWTALYSTEIARALSFRVSVGASKSRRAVHYGLAWGVPLVCVTVGLGADKSELEFRPFYGPPQCFIGSRLGNLTLFMAPLCIFLTVDIVVYVFMIVKLAIIARQTSSVRSSHREKFCLSVKLVFLTGLLWLIAVLASFTESTALYCAFSLVNALQGVFLFAVFVCKREVLAGLRKKSKTSTTTSVPVVSRFTSTFTTSS